MIEKPTDPAPQRVSKLLARRGVCSRREAERLIEAGEVLVDGEPVVGQGAKASPDAVIEVTASGRSVLETAVSVALHKPVGIVSALPKDDQRDARALVTVDTVFGQCAAETVRRVVDAADDLAVAGRLDRASRGLLILTTDGVVARALIGGTGLTKSYLVTTGSDVADSQIARLNRPMRLDDRQLLPMKVRRVGRRRLRFELVEGMKHQIRRCCGRVGLEVEDLLRDAVGPIQMGELPEGKWRHLEEGELEAVRASVVTSPG